MREKCTVIHISVLSRCKKQANAIFRNIMADFPDENAMFMCFLTLCLGNRINPDMGKHANFFKYICANIFLGPAIIQFICSIFASLSGRHICLYIIFRQITHMVTEMLKVSCPCCRKHVYIKFKEKLETLVQNKDILS